MGSMHLMSTRHIAYTIWSFVHEDEAIMSTEVTGVPEVNSATTYMLQDNVSIRSGIMGMV